MTNWESDLSLAPFQEMFIKLLLCAKQVFIAVDFHTSIAFKLLAVWLRNWKRNQLPSHSRECRRGT